MKNAFTIDVEDYYQVEAFAGVVDKKTWPSYESRVENNTRRLLDLLEARAVQGTFFVLGWVAQRHRGLIQEIAARGHEIASHGMSHTLVYTQSPQVFREETRSSKALIEDICQRPVIGYRAATYSITQRSLWALDILHEEGFQYDSSIFPMRHDRYGIPDAHPYPHTLRTPAGYSLAEFPISVSRFGKFKLPVAGGGYFRLFPYALTKWGLGQINAAGHEFVFYLHPWEVDPQQPRIARAHLLSRVRHYLNLARTHPRLDRLLQDFSFTTMQDVLRTKALL
ncbi:MAG: DUF3473 domain-containing protein [Gammaproteobacteria bacterium]|nr:DUF3473 domain-containing protein [Gammaproteobacteria bacterium]